MLNKLASCYLHGNFLVAVTMVTNDEPRPPAFAQSVPSQIPALCLPAVYELSTPRWAEETDAERLREVRRLWFAGEYSSKLLFPSVPMFR